MDLSTRGWIAALLALVLVTGLRAQDGPRTNGANLPIRTDANSYVIVAEQTYTGPDGPRRVFANTLVRTDANGYLIITNPTPLGIIDATYITQTSNATLTAEQALDALASGIMRVDTADGVITSLVDSAGIAANISDETGSDALVFANTPTLVTPVLGVATATSIDFGGTTLLASRALTVDTGGVFNVVLAAVAGDDFTIDTDKLVVEGDTGEVGFGTTNPTRRVSVETSSSTDASLSLGATGTGNAVFFFDASNGDFIGNDYGILRQDNDLTIHLRNIGAASLSLGVNNSDDLTIVTGGDVGVGTVLPLVLFHVSSGDAVIYIESTDTTDATLIIEDTDEDGCTGLTVLNGVATFATVTCPS